MKILGFIASVDVLYVVMMFDHAYKLLPPPPRHLLSADLQECYGC